MGTLKKAKLFMKTDPQLHKLLVRGGRREILIDIDGDKEADILLSDANQDGDIDLIGADILGDGEFNLLLVDTDSNGVPDEIFLDRDGDGEYEKLAAGPEVEEKILEAAQKIAFIIQAKEIIAEELDERLRELDARVREARKELAKRA